MGSRIGGAGRFGPRRVRGGLAMGAKPEKDATVDGSLEVTLEELEEFLDADRHGVHARLEFKESLREKLWHFVQQQRRRWRGDRS